MKRPAHIFLIQDDAFSDLAASLRTLGPLCTLTRFQSGEACLNHAVASPDIIVLDYLLPKMGGYDTLLELRDLHPDIPVIALIDEGEEHEIVRSEAAGAKCLVKTKKQFMPEFIDAISSLVEARQTAPPPPPWYARRQVYYAILIALLVSAGWYYYSG